MARMYCIAPFLVFTLLIWSIDAELPKSHGEMDRMRKEDFRNMRQMRRKSHHLLGRHSSLTMDQDDVLNGRHLEFTIGKECHDECKRHEVCVKHHLTGLTKCVHKKLLQESRRLLKKKQWKKKHQRKGGRKNHRRAMIEKQLAGHEELNRMDNSLNDLGERSHHLRNKQIQAMKKAKKHHKKDIMYRYELFENIDAIDELMRMGEEGPKSETQRKYPACANKMEDIRKRLNGWFVMLHTQKQEHQNEKHRMNQSHLKPKQFGDFRTFGQCKCAASVMWERRSLDKDKDTFLATGELDILESMYQEKCIKPLLESCDTNKDGLLSKKEWCCCFTDTEAPCFAHLRKIKEKSAVQDYMPQCTTEGYYERTQCDATAQYCWCTDLDGTFITDTKRHVRSQGSPNCDRYDSTGRLREL